jgi:hypothetical protein
MQSILEDSLNRLRVERLFEHWQQHLEDAKAYVFHHWRLYTNSVALDQLQIAFNLAKQENKELHEAEQNYERTVAKLEEQEMRMKLFHCGQLVRIARKGFLRRGLLALRNQLKDTQDQKAALKQIITLLLCAADNRKQLAFAQWTQRVRHSKEVEENHAFALERWSLLRLAKVWDAWVDFRNTEKLVLKFSRVRSTRHMAILRRSAFSGWLRLCLSKRLSVKVQRDTVVFANMF